MDVRPITVTYFAKVGGSTRTTRGAQARVTGFAS